MSNLLFIRILLIILSQFFYVFNEKFLRLLSPLSRSHIVGTETSCLNLKVRIIWDLQSRRRLYETQGMKSAILHCTHCQSGYIQYHYQVFLTEVGLN